MATKRKTTAKKPVRKTTAKPAAEAKVEETKVEAPEVVEETTAVPAEEAKVEEPKTEAVVETKAEEKPAPKKPTAKKVAGGGEPNPSLVAGLAEYIENMNPKKPMDMDKGGRHQKKLRALVIGALMEADDKVSMANIKHILNTIHEDATGTFSDRALYRFFDTAKWASKDERREIETIMALMVGTANPETRGAELKKMELSNLKQFVVPQRYEQIFRRLTMFFGNKA